MHRVKALLAAAVLVGGGAFHLAGVVASAELWEGGSKETPRPTGRTMEDLRAELVRPSDLRANVDAEAPPARQPRIVQADVFAVTDEAGNVRAEMGASVEGMRMRMFDTRGKVRLVLGEKDGVSTVSMIDDQGKAALELRLTPGGQATVALGTGESAHWDVPLVLRAGEGLEPGLVVRNEAGERAAEIFCDRSEGGRVEVLHERTEGHLYANGLFLSHPELGPKASLAMGEHMAQLSLQGEGVKTQLVMESHKDTASLDMRSAGQYSTYLAADESGSWATFRSPGGGREVFAGNRINRGQIQSHVRIYDAGLPKINLTLEDGKPKFTMIAEQGPVIFEAP